MKVLSKGTKNLENWGKKAKTQTTKTTECCCNKLKNKQIYRDTDYVYGQKF